MMNFRSLRMQCLLLCASVLTSVSRGQGQSPANLFRHDSPQVWNTSSGLPQDTVHQFLQTRDGFLWMATDGGLVRFDGYDFTVNDRRNTPQMQSDLINGLLEDKQGNLWVATSNGLLKRSPGSMGEGRFIRYTTQQGLPSDSISSTFEDHAGRLCAETSSGTACLTPSGFSAVFSPSHNAPGQLSRPAHAGPAQPWSAAPTGLLHTDHGQASIIPMPEGFTGTDVLTIYPDREGNIWVGSENAGAAVVRRPPFSTIGKRDGLADDQVRSLLQDAQGDLWFGTGAGLTRLHQGAFSTIAVPQGLASNEILTLAGVSADDLWVGTPDGLSHLQQREVETLTASDGLPDDNIRSLLLARDSTLQPTLWIGTSHGLASLPQADPAQAKSIHTFTQADGLGSNVIGSLLEDADGSLWIGTLNGLSHLAHGQIRNYAAADGLSSTIITALGEDQRGNLWIGTNGGGLFTFHGGKIAHVGTTADETAGRLPATIYSIIEDATQHLWLSSSTGVYRIAANDVETLTSHQKPASEVAIDHSDVADGLRLHDFSSGGHPEAALTAQGLLWFATQKGASVVDTHSPALDRPAPPVSIENITIDDASVVPQEINGEYSFRVPAGHARLSFHYAGLSLATPSKVRYRYQLEHFDHGWIDAGMRRTAYYTNISPGRYMFLVQASMNGADWSSTTAAVAFTIAPHYYQTWWFYTLLAVLLALIAWQLYLYRLRQVELRFNAVLAERGRIAREIHDTLAQDIVGISVQLELVSRLMTVSLDKAKAQLQETKALVRKSLAGARSSIWDLRSSTSGQGGDLPTRLRDTAKQLCQDSHIALQMKIGGTYRAFPQTTEDELLRIAQEAITNAVRHAAAKTISVLLNYHEKGARLEVHDDGRGFVMENRKSGPEGHYGIRGMHERAERAHATLEIQSAPGSGTTVIAEAPQD